VKVEADGQIPADMALIHTEDDSNSGECYVLTKNLDGETNLKRKYAPKILQQEFRTERNLR